MATNKMMTKAKYFAVLFILTRTILTVTCFGTLKIETYNPQQKALFPTSASLIEGFTNAIQMDAEFTLPDGEKVAERIKASGKKLKLIIISCGDPDYYFGLQSIVKYYPDVKIVASRTVVDHIIATKDEKLKTYAPMLKDKAPTKLYVPEVIDSTYFFLDFQPIVLKSEKNYAAYYYIPYQDTILGGVGISWNIYPFTADTNTTESREGWRDVLQEMIDLKPKTVIPGHYLGKPPDGDKAIRFTKKYLEDYEDVLKKNNYKNSAAVIRDMKKLYPNLGLESNLELGAKVNTGEMQFSK